MVVGKRGSTSARRRTPSSSANTWRPSPRRVHSGCIALTMPMSGSHQLAPGARVCVQGVSGPLIAAGREAAQREAIEMCGTTTIETEVTMHRQTRAQGRGRIDRAVCRKRCLAIAARGPPFRNRPRTRHHGSRSSCGTRRGEARRTQSPRPLSEGGVLGREIAGHGQRSRLARHERERP